MKIPFFAIIAVLFVSPLSATSAEYHWTLLAHPVANLSVYKKVYQLKQYASSCRVYTRKDQDGLTLIASEQGSDDQLNLMIKVNSYGIVELNRVLISKPGTDTTNFKDVFGSLCLPAAQSLPRPVKDLFFGYYGLGSKPTRSLLTHHIHQN